MKERVITAIGLIAVVLAAIAFGNIGIRLLIAAFIAVACYEVYKVKKGQVAPMMLAVIALFVFFGGYNVGQLGISFYLIGLLITLFFIAIVFEWFSLDDLSYVFLMTSLLILGVNSISLVLNYNLLVLLYIFIATFATDTFAYFGGSFFGKHKLIERISPKKTVEGAIIGYVSSVILSVLFGHFFLRHELGYKLILVLSILIPIFSQIGDLAFSLVKRQYNIKDFGNVFPGHGGVLDRIDSVLFALLTFSMVMSVFARLLWV